jgi:hypothetical protein
MSRKTNFNSDIPGHGTQARALNRGGTKEHFNPDFLMSDFFPDDISRVKNPSQPFRVDSYPGEGIYRGHLGDVSVPCLTTVKSAHLSSAVIGSDMTAPECRCQFVLVPEKSLKPPHHRPVNYSTTSRRTPEGSSCGTSRKM